MNVLVDMNLPPTWAVALRAEGIEARHWVSVGSPTAPDRSILEWARTHHCIVLTLDLDFQQLLFATRTQGPSVFLLRVRDALVPSLPAKVARIMIENRNQLAEGCLIVMDENRARIRRLPLRP